MIPVKPIDPEDLPLFAMQLLPPEQMEEMRRQLQHSVEGMRVLDEIYSDLGIVAHGIPLQEPSSGARQRLMEQVGREKRVLPAGPLDQYRVPAKVESFPLPLSSPLEVEPARRNVGATVLGWTGWLMAAGISAFAVLQFQQINQLHRAALSQRVEMIKSQQAADSASALMQTLEDPAAVHATLTGAEAPQLPSGRITYVPNRGSLFFIANNLQPLEPAKTYELWVIPADGRPPIPAGTFRPDQHGYASVVLPEIAKGIDAKAFGVTIEEAEGSLIPTPPVILSGHPS
jgi:hypothetical protein